MEYIDVLLVWVFLLQLLINVKVHCMVFKKGLAECKLLYSAVNERLGQCNISGYLSEVTVFLLYFTQGHHILVHEI